MEDTIYCLVGPSGSGKTTVAREMYRRGYGVILSFTTRPRRDEWEWGHEFVDEFTDTGDVIAYNKFNGYEYWATKKQYEGMGPTFYIIDPIGDEMLRGTVDVPVVTIFLSLSAEQALNRMSIERGRESAVSRVIHDGPVFSCVKCDWVINADNEIGTVADMVEQIVTGKRVTV